jgi:hypothetical protein
MMTLAPGKPLPVSASLTVPLIALKVCAVDEKGLVRLNNNMRKVSAAVVALGIVVSYKSFAVNQPLIAVGEVDSTSKMTMKNIVRPLKSLVHPESFSLQRPVNELVRN